ncbi:MAG TPA: hypothetical protein PKN61_15725 [Acidobacteriota bacterium]|jgi:hypothetical protein|nr:hypothetical protein [Phycisphaerae bacterium]HNR40485.1 hypothetical protein [Acidobacteriota bacterium]HQO27367.1 hypothetical protein [Acidobacteriota bacterium]
MKALLFPIVIIAGVFCLAQDAPAQALAKEAAAETIRRHYADTPDWWQQEGCFLMLTAGGEINQKLLARMKLSLADYLHKNYQHLEELEQAGLVTVETGERTDGQVKKYTYQVKLTEKMRRNNRILEREKGWTIATYLTRELVSIDSITGVLSLAPDRGATVTCTRRLKVSPFGRAIGLEDRTETTIIQLVRPEEHWRVNDGPVKFF